MAEQFFEPADDLDHSSAPIEEIEPVLEFEPISFLSNPVIEPNYDYLMSATQSADSGATMLLAVLAHTGYTEPLVTISDYKGKYMLNIAEQNELEKQARKDDLNPDENSQLRFLRLQEAQLIAGLAPWNQIEDRIKQAKLYYQAVIVGPDVADSTDALESMYDETDQYMDSGLLSIITKLRSKIQNPRNYTGGRAQPNPILNNAVEAERLVRLLILEETGQISFD